MPAEPVLEGSRQWKCCMRPL